MGEGTGGSRTRPSAHRPPEGRSQPYEPRRRRPPNPPDPARDVRAAHAALRRADTGLGPRRPPRRTVGDRLHDFIGRWGWRAYAIPVLAVVTVIALVTSTSSDGSPAKNTAAQGAAQHGAAQAPVLAPSHIDLKTDAPGADAITKVPKGSALPAGPAYTKQGDGTFRTLPGTTPVVGDSGKLFRYSIDVEKGVTGIDLTQFQQLVTSTLDDPRSWSGHGVRLKRVDSDSSGHIDFHVTMTSALTVRKLCGYTIPIETSCYAPASGGTTPVNRVVFDDARWVRGATAYLGDLTTYRRYMINHEDGHALGHEHAHQCLPGGLAPAMMQQTFGLRSSTTNQLCMANPWPYPTGVKIGPNGAPGAEQQDTDRNNEYYIGD